MQQEHQLEQIIQHWVIDTFTGWQTIQDNAARVTLSDGRVFVLKKLGPSSAEAIERLRFEHDALRHVEQSGVPVAIPLISDQYEPYVLDSGTLYRFSHWLPIRPATPKNHEERVRLYRNYGEAIARFHRALARYEDEEIQNRTWQTELKKRTLDEAVPVILAHLSPDQRPSFEALLMEVEPGMRSTYANLPIQLIIWDCHPGNVAVDGFDVSGFIDCDHLSLGPRILDLADFLVHLIKWDIGDAEKAAIWLADFPYLIAGYNALTPLSREEQAALPYAMVAIPLIFMDFFLQNGLLEPVQLELDTLEWLVRHLAEIAAGLEVG